VNIDEITSIAITDCGSTTTKALLVEKVDGVFRQTARGDAPTTVEEPHLDITEGVKQSLRAVEAMRGRRLLNADGDIIRPAADGAGVDLYLSTSSAGGGLQMAAAGLVRKLSAKAAERAALGAGAIVSHVIACDDEMSLHEQIEALREVRPDMLLIAGGTDRGAIEPVVEIAEILVAANPRTRLGKGYAMPVIFAGNKDAADAVRKVIPKDWALFVEDNVMRTVDEENLTAAKERVHTLFLEHVMRQAPGFGKLAGLTDAPVVPTPSAAQDMLALYCESSGENALLVDIGGATTDIFSMVKGKLNRTVSANLGMSYSAARVLIESSVENIQKLLPMEVEEGELTDLIMNKTVRPTTIPDSRKELLIEQALAKEALRLSLAHHASFVGTSKDSSDMDVFKRGQKTPNFSMLNIDIIIGSGGVISHASSPAEAAQMLVDGFLPEGVTRLVKDSVFMMPHLGLLSRVHKEAALLVFQFDCIEELGTVVAPKGNAAWGAPCLSYCVERQGEKDVEGVLFVGDFAGIDVAPCKEASLQLKPKRGFDVGEGPGRPVRKTVRGGPLGILLDGRGRPLIALPGKLQKPIVKAWFNAFGIAYDKESKP
jgi:uncharacterized protein (TIGR01319 family)